MEKSVLSVVSAALAAVWCGFAQAAPKGSCESLALAMSPSPSGYAVSLVAEYDKEDGTSDVNSPVFYAKITVKRGNSYTVSMENADPGVELIDVGQSFEDESIVSAFFSPVESGGQELWVLNAEDWYYDPQDKEGSDPASATFYIMLSGYRVGDKATLYFQNGIQMPKGTVDNPLRLNCTETLATDRHNLIEGSFYYTFDGVPGCKYVFATEGGKAGNQLLVAGLQDYLGKLLPYPALASANNDSVSFVPQTAGTYVFAVTGNGTNDADRTASFALKYRRLPSRTIKQHAAEAKSVSVGAEIMIKPGRLNKANSGAYDEIIDEQLFALSAAKGGRYYAETLGADTNLIMRVYDSNGTIIAENLDMGGSQSPDVRCAFETPKAGVYYIGVCQNLVDDDNEKPTYHSVQLSVKSANPVAGSPDEFDPTDDVATGANGLAPVPGSASSDPVAADKAGSAAHKLGATDWEDWFAVAALKNQAFALKASLADSAQAPAQRLTAEVYTLSGKKLKPLKESEVGGDINVDSTTPFRFTASADNTYYVKVSVKDGVGLDYPAYRIHAVGYSTASGVSLGAVKVNIRGTAEGTWTIDSGRSKYPGGAAILVAAGSHTVKFGQVKGFGTPANATVSVTAGKTAEIERYYGDTFDPKDDQPSGRDGSVTYKATSWSLKNAETEKTALARTLWKGDPADCFEIAGKDGYLYDIHLDQDAKTDRDAVFTIADANGKIVCAACTEVSQQQLPATASKKYYLKVVHKDANKENWGNTAYSINGHFENVGAIKFSKATMSVKDSATSVKLTVNRTAKTGMVRVRCRTVAGSARANEQFIPKEEIFEWADKDSKARTFEVKLIPKLLSIKTGDTNFKVVLEDAGGQYPAPISTPVCTVTIQDSGKYADAGAAYKAANKTKKATVKDETVSLRGGTYYGVVQTLSTSNGLPALASVTLTVGAKEAGDPSKDTISAKVMLAGKTYTFKPGKDESAWDEGEPGAGGIFRKKLLLTQKIGTVTVSNVLSVTVHDGVPGDWTATVKEDVSLTMNVPDAKGKGYQANVKYAGGICRQNAKIQNYLDVAYSFAGYYTAALVADDAVLTSGKVPVKDSGLPSGNGYLTVTVDNKGGAKVAGVLADGTKVSVSATACEIVKDDKSAVIGYSMLVPVYLAKSPYCFGGWLKLTARADSGRPDGRNYKIVVDTLESELLWNNDNAALTYDGKEGWRLALMPVGGWYDKVFNLQAYYNDWAQQFSIDTIEAKGFPTEILPSGYRIVTAVQPDGEGVDLAGDKFATDKKSLVKRTDNKKLNDWGKSVNACNVQVKLARATGIVTGSCSVWSESSSAQKEITGFKHNGVITLDRDDGVGDFLPDDVISAGFLNKSIKIGRRNWAFSVPFNILAD